VQHPAPILAASGDIADAIAVAQDLIAGHGIGGIEPAFALLREAGIEAVSEEAQGLLIEALFQLLEGLEQDPADSAIAALVLRFDVAIAWAAADLLILANFPDGEVDPSQLDDGSVLLLSLLLIASGQQPEALDHLYSTKIARLQPRFQQAATQLQYLAQPDDDAAVDLLFQQTLDGLDHPEIWRALPAIVARFPELAGKIDRLTEDRLGFYTEYWGVIHALCIGAAGDLQRARALLVPLATAHSQSLMVQGAWFHLSALLDPDNAVDLDSRFCSIPFEALDVISGRSHLCCASWLPASVGDLEETAWRDVWNSDTALSIRASILDGSFRHCNKTACPLIGSNRLPRRDDKVATARWRDVIENFRTELAAGPKRVNLAYDETCNLSCPSCRSSKIAADSATRARFDKLQDEQILPMLKTAELALVTGSGDPFASKNFRKLLEALDPETYPDLRFGVMTNGMLLTPRDWERFPTLHRRTDSLRISLDAATGPTHELLRRGARWSVMEHTLAFAGELRAQGQVKQLHFAFVVQAENYHEMGDMIALAHRYGADHVLFGRLTNWGTFTAEQYARKAVFMPSHPQHADFLAHMHDPRLRDPAAVLGDLSEFLPRGNGGPRGAKD
jgi:hypothetical protein